MPLKDSLPALEKQAQIEALRRSLHETQQTLWLLEDKEDDAVETNGEPPALEEPALLLSHAERLAHMGSWDHDLVKGHLNWSAQVYEIFGVDPEKFEVSYESFFRLVHPDDRANLEAGRARAVHRAGLLENEYRILRPDGEERVLQQRGEVVYDADGKAVRRRGMIIDVTDRRHAEALAAAQREILEMIIRDAGLNTVLHAIVRLVEQRLPGALCSILLVDRDQRLRLGAAPGLPPDYSAAIDGVKIGPQSGSCGTAAFTGRPVIVRDIGSDPLWRDYRDVAMAHGLRACWSTPISAREQTVLATFAIYYRECHAPLPEEMSLVEAITHLAGLAISHQRAEEALRASDLQFANAFEHASIGMALVAPDGRWLKVNRSLCQMLGYSEAEMEASRFHDITHPEDLPGNLAQVARVLAGEVDAFQLEKRYFHKHGQIVWSLLNVSLVRDMEGRPVHFIAQVQDVTQRKRAEMALRASESKFRSLADSNVMGIIFCDLQGEVSDANEAFLQMVGYSRKELRAGLVNWRELTPPEQRWLDERALEEIATTGRCTPYEKEYLRKDGSRLAILLGAALLEGMTDRIVCFLIDVTPRKQAEERIAQQAALLDKAQDAITVRSLEQVVLFWNKGAERLYGWTADEVMGRNLGDFLYLEAERLAEARKVTLDRGEWSGELLQRTKGGKEIRVESRWSLLRDASGRPKSILSINTDITERKKLEAQFLRAQRMESIGTLAGGIAHDLNNVLAPIMMSIDLLKLRTADPLSLEMLSLISTSAKRGAEMVSQVLYFARGIEGERIALDTSGLLRDLRRFVKDTFPKNIAFELTEGPGLWPVIGDATQIYQVLLNLCVNARDAMPDGGQVTLSVGNVTVDEQHAEEGIDARPGRFVVFQIQDAGTGIPPEIIDKIFDPFFTTKEVGKGTGLGLSTSMAIVRSHGGFLQVTSQPGAGTCFRIYLPEAGESLTGGRLAGSQELRPGGGELVLVVDDEAAIRQVTGQMLEAFGYRVLTASNGAEALEMFKAQRAGISVVLTDMMMPVMDGLALIHALRQLDPDVRMIAASGIGVAAQIARATEAGVRYFIAKPYAAEPLLSTLTAALQSPGEDDAPARLRVAKG